MTYKLLTKLALGSALMSLAALGWGQSACVTSNATFQNASFPAMTALFTAAFDVTPSMAKMDGLVGLSNGSATAFTSLATIVRFNNLGTIDARNGSGYAAALSVPYSAGLKYHFRLVIDPTKHVYSVYVTPPNSTEKTLGTNYAFRTEQASTSSLNNWTPYSDSGSEQVCGFTASANAAPAPTTTALTASTAWQNLAFAAQTAPFTAAFDVTPKAAGIDSEIGLSKGPATAFTSLATIVRFNSQNLVDVRNGSAYAADVKFPYAAGSTYHFRVAVDPTAHRYSVYATAPGGAETLIASSYAFRTEQATTSSLSDLGLIATTNGADVVANFGVSAGATVAPPPDTTAPTVSLSAPASGATVSGTVTVSANASDNVGVAGVQFMLDGAPLGAEVTAAPYTTAWNTTSATNASHTLTAVARDAAGNKTTSAPVAVTVSNVVAQQPPPPAAGYNQVVLNDHPVMYLPMDTGSTGAQIDLSGNGNSGTYMGGTPGTATLPNGDKAADFNGSSEYLSVKPSAALSVPTSGILTIESWIKPDTLQFPNSEAEGYVYFLGKGDPTNGYEYANRMYSLTNTANRPNRISDYAWNKSGGLGSGAYFQDPVTTSQWIMVTDIINMKTGTISIYKDGVLRGNVPLSQYNVTPSVTNAPFNVGTRNFNSWFQGAIGKVAVFNYALSASQIANHYTAMTGLAAGTASVAPASTASTAPTGTTTTATTSTTAAATTASATTATAPVATAPTTSPTTTATANPTPAPTGGGTAPATTTTTSATMSATTAAASGTTTQTTQPAATTTTATTTKTATTAPATTTTAAPTTTSTTSTSQASLPHHYRKRG